MATPERSIEPCPMCCPHIHCADKRPRCCMLCRRKESDEIAMVESSLEGFYYCADLIGCVDFRGLSAGDRR